MLALNRDFPDPGLLFYQGMWYAFATNEGGVHIQMASSPDGVHWEYLGEALPDLPAWVQPGQEWAPRPFYHRGRFLLYFAAHHRETNQHALGLAWSWLPTGPYQAYPLPLLVGYIDPEPFLDETGLYLLYAGCGATQGSILSQRLSPDGLGLWGEPIRVLTADRPGEKGVVEAPKLLRSPAGPLVLLYSAASFASPDYGIFYAFGEHPQHPFHKPWANTLLASGEGLVGPGAPDICQGKMAYHSWHGPTQYPQGYRALHIERFGWDGLCPILPERDATTIGWAG